MSSVCGSAQQLQMPMLNGNDGYVTIYFSPTGCCCCCCCCWWWWWYLVLVLVLVVDWCNMCVEYAVYLGGVPMRYIKTRGRLSCVFNPIKYASHIKAAAYFSESLKPHLKALNLFKLTCQLHIEMRLLTIHHTYNTHKCVERPKCTSCPFRRWIVS